jgi:hypothetical protein
VSIPVARRTPATTRSPALALLLPLLAAPIAAADLGEALRRIPPDAAGFVAIPSLKRASDDLGQLLERMDRPGTALLGRPLDQLKAQLGISVAVEDRGPLFAYWPAAGADGVPAAPRVFVPTLDPEGFLAGNFTAAPQSGPDAHADAGGTIWFARGLDGFALLSQEAEAVRGYDPGEGLLAAWRDRMGDGWFRALNRADFVAWGGERAVADLARQGRAAMPADLPPEVQAGLPAGAAFDRDAATRWAAALEASLGDGLVSIEFDPLGVAIRTYALLREGSPLAALVASADRSRAASFDRLPRNPYYLAASIDLMALGGAEPLRRFAALAGLPEGGWLEVAATLRSAQFAAYPSRLGLATGGFLNDSSLVVESSDAAAVRTALERAIAAMQGDGGGVRRSASFERDRRLRDGTIADAFLVEQNAIPAGAPGAEEAGLQEVATRQLLWQVLFGSRGLNGFHRAAVAGDGVSVVTFSQRPDVFGRAVEAAGRGESLQQDGTIRAMREWLPRNAQVVGFVGVGQFGRLLRQLAGLVPGGLPNLPEIATNIEPIGVGLAIGEHRVETTLVLPAGVVGLGYDQVLDGLRRGAGLGLPGPRAGAVP